MPLCKLWRMKCGQKRYAALPGLNHKVLPQKSLPVSLFSIQRRAARERQTQREPREHSDFKTTRNKSHVMVQLAWELTWIMVAYPRVCWRDRSRKSRDQGHFGLLMPLSQQANIGITTINKPDWSGQLHHNRGEKDYVWSVEDPSRPLLEFLYPWLKQSRSYNNPIHAGDRWPRTFRNSDIGHSLLGTEGHEASLGLDIMTLIGISSVKHGWPGHPGYKWAQNVWHRVFREPQICPAELHSKCF